MAMNKKRIVLSIIAVITLFLAYWLYSHSFVEVTVETTDANTELTYSFTNQNNGKVADVKTKSTTTRKLVNRSSYEVIVKQGNGNHFSVVKTKGFLGTTKVAAKLESEKSRSFIGNNPEQCAKYTNNILLSYVCGGYYGDTNIHRPATARTSSYTEKMLNPGASGINEGFVTNNGSRSVVIFGSIDEEEPAKHQIYRVGDDYRLTDRLVLDELDPSKTYQAVDQGSGFLVYDSSFEQVYVYKNAAEDPALIKLEKPKNTELQAQSFDSISDKYLVLYASKVDENADNPNSEVVITEASHSFQFKFDKHYTQSKFCGASKICLTSNGMMDVFDIAGAKAKYLYSVTSVATMASSNAGFLVITKNGVLSLDVDSRDGYFSYSFGDYKFNDINVDKNGYVLGVTNNRDRKVALWVDQGSVVGDNIDKKILDLQKNSVVKSASVYANFIYVSADIGELVKNPDTGRNEYDPATKQAAAKKINEEIDRLGIDRNVYTISSNAF